MIALDAKCCFVAIVGMNKEDNVMMQTDMWCIKEKWEAWAAKSVIIMSRTNAIDTPHKAYFMVTAPKPLNSIGVMGLCIKRKA